MPAFFDAEVYRSLLESLPTGLCVVDLQKKIVLWSDGAERITGHLRHEVIGQSCVGEPLLHCDQQDCEWCHDDCPMARAIKTSQPADAMGFLHHKEGHEIPIRARAVPVRNAHGSIIGGMEIFDQEPAAEFDRREQDPPGCMDEVTGVASEFMMRTRLRQILGILAEVQIPFGVLLVRLEGLEHFRASFGPDAAASLLRVVARTLAGALWRTDFVSRWSDDQFLVILNGCREVELHSVRERVHRMLATDGIEWWGERRSLPVSIGQAPALPGDSIESLLERAQKSVFTTSTAPGRPAATCDGIQSSGSE